MADYTPNYENTVGVVRCNLSSPYHNSGNGVILGMIECNPSPIATENSNYLTVDTTQNNGAPLVNIPSGQGSLTIQFTEMDEVTLLPDEIPEYQVILTFKIIDE